VMAGMSSNIPVSPDLETLGMYLAAKNSSLSGVIIIVRGNHPLSVITSDRPTYRTCRYPGAPRGLLLSKQRSRSSGCLFVDPQMTHAPLHDTSGRLNILLKKNGFIFSFASLKGLSTPRIPIYQVIRVLEKIGSLFISELIPVIITFQ
jgi:hypothetical protein